MELPVKFPSDADVVAEEAARFRAMSPEQRMRALRGVIAAGALMLRNSPNAAFHREQKLEQERQFRQAFLDLVAQHGVSVGSSNPEEH